MNEFRHGESVTPNVCDQRAAGVDSALSETSLPPIRCIALLFAILRDGLVT